MEAIQILQNKGIHIANTFNQSHPNYPLSFHDVESGVLVFKYFYFRAPTKDQIAYLESIFPHVEIVDMEDDSCGTLYPIFCKL